MFSNYLKIAFRNLWRNKSYTVINLFGLSIGIAATLLIVIYILFEFSYDQFHENKDSIYRISVVHQKEGKMEYESPVYTPPIGPAMKKDFPEIEDFVRISTPRPVFVHHNETAIRMNKACYADTSFFKLFSFELLTGDPGQALASPFSIVLSENMAKTIFPNENPLNKIINLNNKDNFKITGIVKDPPQNSTIQFNALISFSTLYKLPNMYLGWNGGNQYITFVKLNDITLPSQVEEKLPDLMWRNHNSNMADIGVVDKPYLQSLNKMHVFYDNLTGRTFLYLLIFGAVATLILIMACVNFINLSTSLSTKRAKEVGVRKVLGAEKSHLVKQFLTESFLLSFFALILALFLVEIFFPIYTNLIGKQINISSFLQLKLIFISFFVVLFVGFLAGSYPAFYVSSFQAVKTIKGIFETKKGKQGLRNTLVVLQFSISVILIICTILLQKQINFMNNRDLGFQKENIIVLNMPYDDVRNKTEMIKQKLLSLPEIQYVSASSAVPIRGFTRNGYFPEGFNSPMMIHVVDVDEEFFDVFNLKTVDGRKFSSEFQTDKQAYMINETLAKTINWDQPVGKTIERNGKHQVIGVVKDFHFSTLYSELAPLIITNRSSNNQYRNISVKVQSTNWPQTISSIQTIWKKITPSAPFEYYFLDQEFDQLYRFEHRFKNIFLSFCLLALLISLLGLYSLSSFSTELRTKEVGIRKVMGASTTGIIGLFSKNFAILVIIANVIAFPISWFIMTNLLQNFAYRISINWLTFILAGCISLFMAISTVSLQSLKTALTNPVNSMRYE